MLVVSSSLTVRTKAMRGLMNEFSSILSFCVIIDAWQKLLPPISKGAQWSSESNDCVVRAASNATGKPSESCLIVQSPDEKENGIPNSSTTGHLWRKHVHGYDFSKLTVM